MFEVRRTGCDPGHVSLRGSGARAFKIGAAFAVVKQSPLAKVRRANEQAEGGL